jgi:Ribbon-helix-helix domain
MPELRTNVYLTSEQKKLLERLSDKTGAPVAELIRRAIDGYLVARKKELKWSGQQFTLGLAPATDTMSGAFVFGLYDLDLGAYRIFSAGMVVKLSLCRAAVICVKRIPGTVRAPKSLLTETLPD